MIYRPLTLSCYSTTRGPFYLFAPMPFNEQDDPEEQIEIKEARLGAAYTLPTEEVPGG